MEQLINQLIEKVGLDRGTAEKVVAFLQEHASELPKWLNSNDIAKGMMDNLPGGLGGMFGNKQS